MVKGFRCDRCNCVLRSKYKLKKHKKLHEGEELPTCDVCNRVLKIKKLHTNYPACKELIAFSYKGVKWHFGRGKNKYTLKKHLWLHTGKKPHECSVCQQKFALKSYLQLHYKKHSDLKPFSCSICCASFRQKHNLVLHQRVHTGDRPFSCQQCDRAFSQKNNLENHLTLHHGKNAQLHHCQLCKKSFALKSYLQKHLRHALSHIGTGSHICKVCNKRYTEIGTLTKHMRTHSKIKPYKCVDCRLKFTWKESFERHRLVHSIDGNKFYCSQCNQSFRRKTYLVQHVNRHHSKEVQAYPCPVCKKTYATKEYVKKHLKNIHVKPEMDQSVRCDSCGKMYRSLQHLTNHMSVHLRPFHCQLCKESFSCKNNLTNHSKIHLEYYDQYQCGICKKLVSCAGNLKRHIVTVHSREAWKNLKENQCPR